MKKLLIALGLITFILSPLKAEIIKLYTPSNVMREVKNTKIASIESIGNSDKSIGVRAMRSVLKSALGELTFEGKTPMRMLDNYTGRLTSLNFLDANKWIHSHDPHAYPRMNGRLDTYNLSETIWGNTKNLRLESELIIGRHNASRNAQLVQHMADKSGKSRLILTHYANHPNSFSDLEIHSRRHKASIRVIFSEPLGLMVGQFERVSNWLSTAVGRKIFRKIAI